MARHPKAPLRQRRRLMTGNLAAWLGKTVGTIARWIDEGRIRASSTKGVKGEQVRWIPRAEAVRLLKEANRPVAGVWPRFPEVVILGPRRTGTAISRAFKAQRVPIVVRAVRDARAAARAFSQRPAPFLLVVSGVTLRSSRERGDALQAVAVACHAGAPAAILARDETQAQSLPAAWRARAASVIVVATIEQLKDRIWPLVFGHDRRGTRTKRRPMDYGIPM